MASGSRKTELSFAKRALFSVAMVCGTLLVCLVLAELAVREISPQSDLRRRDLFFRYEPFLGAEGIPDKVGVFANSSFKTTLIHNSRGFRDGEHGFANEDGRVRIVTVGDSFTWGHGVENDEIYMKVLEDLVPGVETINLGAPAGDPPGELKVYMKHGLRYEHDVLVIGFYVGNDLVTRVPRPEHSPPRWGFDEDGDFVLIGRQLPPEEVERLRRESEERWARKWEERQSKRFGNLLREHLHLWTLIENARDYGGEIWKGSVLRARIDGLRGRETKSRAFPLLRLCEEEDPEDIAYAWRLLRATLARFQEFAAQAGARPLLMVIPDMYQTWPEYYETTARRYGYDPDEYDLRKPNRKLAALCDELDLACLDLLPRLEGRGEAHYYRRDRHWNAAGHRLAAEALAEELERLGWLRGGAPAVAGDEAPAVAGDGAPAVAETARSRASAPPPR